MTLWIKIPEEWQYGYVAANVGRAGSMQQTTAEYIKRYLFNETATTFSYKRALIAFSRQLLAFNPKQEELQELKRRVLPAADLTAAEQLESVQPFQPNIEKIVVPKSFEALFCIALPQLCLALAQASFAEAYPEEFAEEEAEGSLADRESLEVLAGYTEIVFRATTAQVQTMIAVELARAFPADQSEPEIKITLEWWQLFAAVLTEALLEALQKQFVKEMYESDDPKDKWERYYIEIKQPAMAETIKQFLAKLPYQYTLQPLKQPVQYSLDSPSDTIKKNSFRVELIRYSRSNHFLQRLHAGIVREDHVSAQFDRYIEAINIQQAVPWRINLALLKCVDQLINLVKQQQKQVDPAHQDLCNWIEAEFYQSETGAERKRFERPAEFLDHILARKVLDELCQMDEKGNQPVFYLPWKADYRGRIYAETPWLSPQGGDMQRALFEFVNGKPLKDEASVQALKRHGANLVRRRVILNDLGITDRQVITLAERERWIEQHEAQILASARAPVTEAFWRTVSGKRKPMQFLAFCLAYCQWKEAPDSPIHLPVQIDGTCNGLQHIAALSGDKELAKAVNVLPREDSLPADIYTELSVAARQTIGALEHVAGLRLPEEHCEALLIADKWLIGRKDWLDRETAKKVVMTIPYGAGIKAQAAYVLDAIAAKIEQACITDATTADLISEWIEKNDTDKSYPRSSFRKQCCKGHFKALRKQASPKDKSKLKLWNQRRSLGAYVALALVYHLKSALLGQYASVAEFSKTLQKFARACSDLPLLWVSPLGFVVCQNKFKLQGTSINTRLGSKKIRLDVQRLGDATDIKKQSNALLPNIIHSLDATHLAMTLLSAKHAGIQDIGSIHDCLLCHPNDAAEMSRIVRHQFVKLYQRNKSGSALPNVLHNWQQWMHMLAKLRVLHYRNLVIGALDKPDGLGEVQLNQLQRENDQEAAAALSFVAEARELDNTLYYLLRKLLQYADEQALDSPEEEAKKNKKSGKSSRQKKKSELPDFKVQPMQLTFDRLSEYFFS